MPQCVPNIRDQCTTRFVAAALVGAQSQDIGDEAVAPTERAGTAVHRVVPALYPERARLQI